MNKPIIITLTNRKGGVAKTTTASFMASYLRSKGYKTLIIDMDSQANISIIFKVYDPNSNNTLNLLTGKPFKINKDIISSNLDLYKAETYLNNNGTILNKCILSIYNKYKYDFIVLDTSPSLSSLTTSSLIASNYVVIPTKADKLSYEGTKQTIGIIKSIQTKYNNNLKTLGILLTEYNDRTIINKQFKDAYNKLALNNNTILFKNSIPKGISITEAIALGEDLLSYSPKGKPTLAYKGFMEELISLI